MLHANGYSDEFVDGTLWSDRKNKTKQIFVLEYLCTIRNKDRFLSFLAGGWQWCHFYILQTSISVFLVSANSLVFHNKQMVPSLFF